MNRMERSITDFQYDCWLASACMPSGSVRKLLEHFGSPEACREAVQKHDDSIESLVTPRFVRILSETCSDDTLRQYRQKLEKHSIRSVLFSDPLYPVALKEIQDPPAILFYQGNIECTGSRILGIVGSRAASYTGQKAARKLAQDLSTQGIGIVSGMACGIDASAHRGCIDGKSPTIAVLGCGLDKPYPADNIPLRDEILKNNGLVLSEYAPGEKAAGWHFPVRNRIIVGLSRALILMEARIRSGSMTSVSHALEQGKDVFVYPGDPSSENFEGNHQLLREGGIYFTSARDILEDMHWLDNPPAVRHNSDCAQATLSRTPEEESVIKALKPGTLSFEQLLIHTGMNPPVLMSTLTILQIRGVIEALPGKQYQIKQ